MSTMIKKPKPTDWAYLPAEIQDLILDKLCESKSGLAGPAAVCKAWQQKIEHVNFASIKLTLPRLLELQQQDYLRRVKHLVKNIQLCVELQRFRFSEYKARILDWVFFGECVDDNIIARNTLQQFFTYINGWGCGGELRLDISICSRSDGEHFFKEHTILPDHGEDDESLAQLDELWVPEPDEEHPLYNTIKHGDPALGRFAIESTYGSILGDEISSDWWRSLPNAYAVTQLCLRQETRRRWEPETLQKLLSCFPGLQDFHYEPWRYWSDEQQEESDAVFRRQLLPIISGMDLRKFTLFENFNEFYADVHPKEHVAAIRAPDAGLSRRLAILSLGLESLSASYSSDARVFLEACEPHWRWEKLTRLALTTDLFQPGAESDQVDDLLLKAAAVAAKMPRLETLEIWNGRWETAGMFRYWCGRNERPAAITWRANWSYEPSRKVVDAWVDVAHGQRRGGGFEVVNELVMDEIDNHGEAIHQLGLTCGVVRPVSLQQIRMENKFLGWYFNDDDDEEAEEGFFGDMDAGDFEALEPDLLEES